MNPSLETDVDGNTLDKDRLGEGAKELNGEQAVGDSESERDGKWRAG